MIGFENFENHSVNDYGKSRAKGCNIQKLRTMSDFIGHTFLPPTSTDVIKADVRG